MSDPRLTQFVEKSLWSGATPENVRSQLTAANWPADEIEAALAAWTVVQGVPVPKRRPSLAAGETFQYLLMFATFFMGAGGLMDVLFGFYNAWIPPVDGYANYDVKYGVATLIVAFPVFAFLYVRTSRSVQADAESRNSPARRWLIHLTLLVTAVSTIGGVISLVIGLLEGRGDLNGGLKMATMVALSVATFANYLWELRRSGAALGGLRQAMVAMFFLGIAAIIVGGALFSARHRANPYDVYENGTRHDDYAAQQKEQDAKNPPAPAPAQP